MSKSLPRKLFHFKPLTPTHPGGVVLGRRKVGVREQEGRKMGGGVRRKEGEREEGRRRDD